jgi:hypothetical protein
VGCSPNFHLGKQCLWEAHSGGYETAGILSYGAWRLSMLWQENPITRLCVYRTYMSFTGIHVWYMPSSHTFSVLLMCTTNGGKWVSSLLWHWGTLKLPMKWSNVHAISFNMFTFSRSASIHPMVVSDYPPHTIKGEFIRLFRNDIEKSFYFSQHFAKLHGMFSNICSWDYLECDVGLVVNAMHFLS